ncbi:MAG: hypothetical protein HN348_17950 [Proteobacteria bacterium]|nr:hypothetical protein [Pseudomonadota bacterium]
MWHAVAQTLLLALIVVLANHIASVWFGRQDLTRDQQFSLSESARHSVSRLERPLLAKVYFTGGLQAPYHNHRQALLDKLDELQAYSGGQLEIITVDPTGDRAKTGEAKRFGIQPVTYVYSDWGQKETKLIFMGVSLVYGERQHSIDALPSLEMMEYELVRAIRAVTTNPDDRKKIAFLQGNGEPNLAEYGEKTPVATLRSQLLERYDLQPLQLEGKEGVSEEVDAILVVAPQKPVHPFVQYHLDQFVMGGGRVIWCISGVQPDFQTMLARRVSHGLHGLLGHYGVTLNNDTLIDRIHNEVTVVPTKSGGRPVLTRANYPLAPVTTELNRQHHVVRNVKRLLFPFATTLSLPPATDDTHTGEVWASSSAQSTSIAELRKIDLESLKKPHLDEVRGSFPLIAALSGTFSSFFLDQPEPSNLEIDPDETLLESKPTRMVVISSGDFFTNNPDFMLNAVDWVLEDESLISIRSRNTGFDPMDKPSQGRIWLWRLAIVGAPLVLLYLLGAAVFFRHRWRT